MAGLLGIDAETLRSELVAGKTIAEVATEHGVDPQTVIDALVAEAKTHLDLSVTNGRLTQEEADAKLTEVTERITDRVNNGGPIRQGRGERGDAPVQATADDSASDTDKLTAKARTFDHCAPGLIRAHNRVRTRERRWR